MSIYHVIWRCIEGQTLPCQINIGARCRVCGASVDVRFPVTATMAKPEALWCALCRTTELTVLSAMAVPGASGRRV